jgi:tRNA(His) 5'-end guanylyltransferase
MACICCNGTGAVEGYGVCPLCEGLGDFDRLEETLAAKSEDVRAHLKKYSPTLVPGMDPSLHYLAPHLPKVVWTALGDMVTQCEKTSCGSIDGTQWISLRLDGSGFSKTVRMLRRKGILEKDGYSEIFASCMQSSLRALMEHFHARLGYTQSDEMIVFIPPASIVRGEQQSHYRSGRVTKLTSLAASFVTAHFIMQLAKHCQASEVDLEDLSHILPHFDCRVGHYGSWEEAQALLMWRAYDCSVNGVSDAVYQTKGSGQKILSLGRQEKIAWLWEQGLLPLPRHQAYGTVLVRVKRAIEGYNPKLDKKVRTLRGVIEHVDGPVLELVRTDSLFPDDDELSPE